MVDPLGRACSAASGHVPGDGVGASMAGAFGASRFEAAGVPDVRRTPALHEGPAGDPRPGPKGGLQHFTALE